MFAWMIGASIRHRLLVLVGTCAVTAFGLRAFQQLPIDAVPDLTNVQVQVLTSAPALGPIDVERLVTAPVELAMTGLPGMTELRSVSRYGTSAVTVVFDDGRDPLAARQLVAERLTRAREQIPPSMASPSWGR